MTVVYVTLGVFFALALTAAIRAQLAFVHRAGDLGLWPGGPKVSLNPETGRKRLALFIEPGEGDLTRMRNRAACLYAVAVVLIPTSVGIVMGLGAAR